MASVASAPPLLIRIPFMSSGTRTLSAAYSAGRIIIMPRQVKSLQLLLPVLRNEVPHHLSATVGGREEHGLAGQFTNREDACFPCRLNAVISECAAQRQICCSSFTRELLS